MIRTMLFSLAFLTFIIFSGLIHQHNEGSVIFWSQKRLALDDFTIKAKSRDKVLHGALSDLGINYIFTYSSDGRPIAVVQNYFNPAGSYIYDGYVCESTLVQEQGHFDINEVIAIKISNIIKKNKKKFAIQDENLLAKIDSLADNCSASMHKEYDRVYLKDLSQYKAYLNELQVTIAKSKEAICDTFYLD
jgi:hypothetical protein